ncbi:GSCFA domain-containing protein [Stenotrophomonas acidaminiphila]|uniref:GSCFA domain-containing protein n=1 Tax=Stenotrophomonas acidaminiphila TaxID=128780 RepID=UPI002ABE5F49|nr:GSCFA domain-containing protein [Stenotrophomonas acidaminiphila]WPU54512.1 GSCFA domain-containing protein [Stenotrophomonas acidaminiphila]
MTSPYDDLSERSRWSRAVAQRAPDRYADIYRKKFEISKKDRIVTAGSCFAQHIARRLAASGFAFMDYEPAPTWFPDALRGSFNYGVYSARYCNIYTVRQLLQLFERAYGLRKPVDDMWVSKAGIHDPFRPAVEPVPFASEVDFQLSRTTHLEAVRKVFEQSDLFICTLGLTEAWTDARDGAVFPICPGTKAGGVFNPERHAFHNFTYQEILADFRQFENLLREVNPGIRFLLTVSPVPLVATASGQHVLSATVYSKSVLRAVAGQLSQESERIDYFPSYELASAFPSGTRHFEADLRSVKPSGVDYVMSHFFAEHLAEDVQSFMDERPEAGLVPHAEDAICEEMFLELRE